MLFDDMLGNVIVLVILVVTVGISSYIATTMAVRRSARPRHEDTERE